MEGVSGTGWVWVAVLGILAGSISGMLGVGSGIVVVPALVLLFAFPQKSAQGTALMVMAPMALVSAIRYCLNSSVSLNMKVAVVLGLFAVAGAMVGSSIAFAVPETVLRRVFAVFVIASGMAMLLKK